VHRGERVSAVYDGPRLRDKAADRGRGDTMDELASRSRKRHREDPPKMSCAIPTVLVLTLLNAVGAAAAPTDGRSGEGSAVPFIDDDYKRALSEAHARDLPLFIEAWAPW
jgi:hypothetical protein